MYDSCDQTYLVDDPLESTLPYDPAFSKLPTVSVPSFFRLFTITTIMTMTTTRMTTVSDIIPNIKAEIQSK